MFIGATDGTDRTPRDAQQKCLEWLERLWPTGKHIVIIAPTATGKSWLSRTLQRVVDAPIITPFNSLVKQYVRDYPELNQLIGKIHYANEFDYQRACLAAAGDEDSIFNVASYWFYQKRMGGPHSVCIVDEAHKVLPLLASMTQINFSQRAIKRRCNAIGFSDIGEAFEKGDMANDFEFIRWLKDWIEINRLYADQQRLQGSASDKTEDAVMQLEELLETYSENSSNYYVDIKDVKGKGKTMLVAPVKIGRSFTKKILGSSRSILLSATLTKPEIDEMLGGEAYEMLELESPIPVESRQVHYRPCRAAFTNRPAVHALPLANHIKQLVNEHGGYNTIVHVTYATAKEMAPLIPKALSHDADSKADILSIFHKEGGIMLASGCEEGLDLKDDLCRLNIITKLQYPYLGNPQVKKRMAMIDGQSWYLAKTLTHLIQACGRSTRNETDWSSTYICDPSFPTFFEKCVKMKLVPKWFSDCVQRSYSKRGGTVNGASGTSSGVGGEEEVFTGGLFLGTKSSANTSFGESHGQIDEGVN